MKLHEVLLYINDDEDGNWFRPRRWKGRGLAFTIKAGEIYRVPSSRGGELFMSYNPEDLMDDWEIISPDNVLKEQAEINRLLQET